MAQQWSTSIAEVILFAFCSSLCYKIIDQNKFVCAAIGATAAASFFGIWRFGLKDCPTYVYKWHRFATRITYTFTPALMASVYVEHVHSVGSMALLVAPMIVTFVIPVVAPEMQDFFMSLLSMCSLLSILYVSFTLNIVSGGLGAMFMVLITIILAQGWSSINGIKVVDLLHFVLMLSLYFLAIGAGVNI